MKRFRAVFVVALTAVALGAACWSVYRQRSHQDAFDTIPAPRGEPPAGETMARVESAPPDSPDASSVPRAEPPRLASVHISGVPHVRQKRDFCGEACAAMWLQRLGQPVDQDYVFDQSGLDPAEARGCYTRELVQALKSIGFDTGPVWYEVPADKLQVSRESLWEQLHADLVAGVPSIVCMHFDDRPDTTEHFRLILGYEPMRDEVIYHEPADAAGADRRMKRQTFFALWPLDYGQDRRTVIRIRLAGSRLRAGETSAELTVADYAQHMMRLKPRIPPTGFSFVIQPPFVIVGDETPRALRRHGTDTIQWAVRRLKAAYFKRDPADILDIWLFKDKESYDKHTREIFGDEPTTPFGYFSHEHRALIMNIDTGGGTLVHELVHPFIAANFPACPAWFNEGLASLYEQCHDVAGQIQGLTNWRLAGLQEAIRAKKVPPFAELCSTRDWQFYRGNNGSGYAQARYLCYYLEQRGLLREFYHRFRDHVESDPTGYRTLKEVLGREDMDAFQKEWEEYVLKLTFP